jgi:hypothetical protein
MKRKEQDNKLQSGLQAYADSVEGSGALTGFRQRLGNWPVYAAAVGSALAFSTSVTANTIVYNGSPNGGSTNIDGNNFSVFLTGTLPKIPPATTRNPSGYTAGARIAGNGSILMTGFMRPLRFAEGFTVSKSKSNLYFQRVTTNILALRTGLLGIFGNWSGGGTGYAPIRLGNGDLGWMKIAVGTDDLGYPVSVDILSWAYNDVPGAPILTGETSNAPEPGSLALALLATGAVGILAFHRRRKAAASQGAGSAQ